MMVRSACACAALLVALPASVLAADAGTATAAHVTFADLSWGSTRRSVRAGLEAQGFSYVAETPDDLYAGPAGSSAMKVICIFTPEDELVYVRVFLDGHASTAAVLDSLHREYGNPGHCNTQNTLCDWERGSEQVTYTAQGDPLAGPGQASLEYTAGGYLVEKYDFEVLHKEYDHGQKNDSM
jgi:hypothetical protein